MKEAMRHRVRLFEPQIQNKMKMESHGGDIKYKSPFISKFWCKAWETNRAYH